MSEEKDDPSRSWALREAAQEAAQNAYAPYSGLRVGAAVLSASGAIHRGCNVECAAMPSGGCAERAAIASAITAEGACFGLVAITVAAIDRHGRVLPVSPCGACRQVLVEFADDARVEYRDAAGAWRTTSAAALLPERFILPPT